MPTGLVDKKYRVPPIYFIRLLLKARNENLLFYRGNYPFRLQIACVRYLMTDLLLQDLNNLSSEGMVQTLAYEKREMLGEQRIAVNKKISHYSWVSSFAGSFSNVKKARPPHWLKS